MHADLPREGGYAKLQTNLSSKAGLRLVIVVSLVGALLCACALAFSSLDIITIILAVAVVNFAILKVYSNPETLARTEIRIQQISSRLVGSSTGGTSNSQPEPLGKEEETPQESLVPAFDASTHDVAQDKVSVEIVVTQSTPVISAGYSGARPFAAHLYEAQVNAMRAEQSIAPQVQPSERETIISEGQTTEVGPVVIEQAEDVVTEQMLKLETTQERMETDSLVSPDLVTEAVVQPAVTVPVVDAPETSEIAGVQDEVVGEAVDATVEVALKPTADAFVPMVEPEAVQPTVSVAEPAPSINRLSPLKRLLQFFAPKERIVGQPVQVELAAEQVAPVIVDEPEPAVAQQPTSIEDVVTAPVLALTTDETLADVALAEAHIEVESPPVIETVAVEQPEPQLIAQPALEAPTCVEAQEIGAPDILVAEVAPAETMPILQPAVEVAEVALQPMTEEIETTEPSTETLASEAALVVDFAPVEDIVQVPEPVVIEAASPDSAPAVLEPMLTEQPQPQPEPELEPEPELQLQPQPEPTAPVTTAETSSPFKRLLQIFAPKECVVGQPEQSESLEQQMTPAVATEPRAETIEQPELLGQPAVQATLAAPNAPAAPAVPAPAALASALSPALAPAPSLAPAPVITSYGPASRYGSPVAAQLLPAPATPAAVASPLTPAVPITSYGPAARQVASLATQLAAAQATSVSQAAQASPSAPATPSAPPARPAFAPFAALRNLASARHDARTDARQEAGTASTTSTSGPAARLTTASRTTSGTTSTTSRPGAPEPPDGLPVYSRLQLEEAMMQARTQLASVLLSDPARAAQLKDRMHYLHCYKLGYEVSLGRDADPALVKQLAVAQYRKQRALLGGENR